MDKEKKTNEYGYNSIFPSILRRLMEERNVTQETLAKYCGTQRQTIGQWKDGNTKPDIMALKKISEFFNTSTDYLLGLTPNSTMDADLRAMCECTGLTQEALESLVEMKGAGWNTELAIFSRMIIDPDLWLSMIYVYRTIAAARNVRDMGTEIALSESEQELLLSKGLGLEILNILTEYEIRDIFQQQAMMAITEATKSVIRGIIALDEAEGFEFYTSKNMKDIDNFWGLDQFNRFFEEKQED